MLASTTLEPIICSEQASSSSYQLIEAVKESSFDGPKLFHMEWGYESDDEYLRSRLAEDKWDLNWAGGYKEAIRLKAKEPKLDLSSAYTQGVQLVAEKYELKRLDNEIMYEQFGDEDPLSQGMVEDLQRNKELDIDIMKMRHKKLEMMEITACYEVAAQTLRVLNDFIFNSSMPATLRWEAETNEINNISQIFTPGMNRHLKLKFLSRLAPNLQVIARIMANAFRKFAIGRNQYHCHVSRTLALDLVTKKFALSEELAKRVHEYIDSDPKYKGDSVFPVDDSRDETGIYQIRENIDRLNCALQKYNLIRSRNILELWEMNCSC